MVEQKDRPTICEDCSRHEGDCQAANLEDCARLGSFGNLRVFDKESDKLRKIDAVIVKVYEMAEEARVREDSLETLIRRNILKWARAEILALIPDVEDLKETITYLEEAIQVMPECLKEEVKRQEVVDERIREEARREECRRCTGKDWFWEHPYLSKIKFT